MYDLKNNKNTYEKSINTHSTTDPVKDDTCNNEEARTSKQIINVDTYLPKNPVKDWIPELQLTMDDKKILETSEWLNDAIVNAAQDLMRKENTRYLGLQNVNLGLIKSFAPISGEFVQILHTGCDHWNVISTIGTTQSTVDVYDSIYCYSSIQTKSQIASILHTKEKIMRIKYIDVMKQAGAADCGIFAIAFSTALINGYQPGKYIFQQNLMRKHMLKCFEKRKITMFPIKRLRRTSYKLKRVENVVVYCTCRMPQEPGLNWIQCFACKEWFHTDTCVKVDKKYTQDRKLKWICSSCT